MDINFEILRIKELVQAFEKAPKAILSSMRLALRFAMREIQRRAAKEHRFRSRSGNLERSISTEVVSESPLVGRVWLDPSVTKAKDGRSYLFYQHEGTRDHFVKPVNKKALRWVGSDGRFWFSKGHNVKGIAPDPFLYKAAENERQNINDIFNRHADEAIRKAGL